MNKLIFFWLLKSFYNPESVNTITAKTKINTLPQNIILLDLSNVFKSFKNNEPKVIVKSGQQDVIANAADVLIEADPSK